MSQAVLVTGAAGFAGSHLLDRLADADTGSRIVAWHRPGGSPPFDSPRTTWDGVDLLDASAVRRAVAQAAPAVVYHCAGAAHVGRAWRETTATFAINVLGTHHLLEALRLAGHPARVLIPGSAMVYQVADAPLTEDHPLIPPSPYGLSKLAQELEGIHGSAGHVTVTIARAFNHVGPRQDPSFSASGFARQIAEIELGRRDPEVLVGNLEPRRDITDVRDMVRAYEAIALRGRPCRPYNVSTGRAIAIGEVLEMLRARARVPIRIRVDDTRLRPNDLPVLVGDASRLRQELGWVPAIPLQQTLDDLLAYWRTAIASAAPRPRKP